MSRAGVFNKHIFVSDLKRNSQQEHFSIKMLKSALLKQ